MCYILGAKSWPIQYGILFANRTVASYSYFDVKMCDFHLRKEADKKRT